MIRLSSALFVARLGLKENLKGHLEAKIATAHAAEVVRKGISESAEAIAKPTRTLRANISALTEGLRTAAIGARDADLQSLDAWLKSLSTLLVVVTEPVERYLTSGLSSDDTVRLFVPGGPGRFARPYRKSSPRCPAEAYS